MIKNNKTKLGIICTVVFGREVLQLALDIQNKMALFSKINFIMFDDFYENKYVDETEVIKISNCNFKTTKFVVAIADPQLRKKIVNELPNETMFTSLISPTAFVSNDLKFGDGLIVMPFSYLSCNVKLGEHVHINSHCAVGHDTKIGDFFTSASSVMIAGNNTIAECCYFGMNSSTKQGLKLSKNIKVGLNSGVVKDLNKSGTYFGTPAKFLF